MSVRTLPAVFCVPSLMNRRRVQSSNDDIRHQFKLRGMRTVTSSRRRQQQQQQRQQATVEVSRTYYDVRTALTA
jgi:hypothetical protein